MIEPAKFRTKTAMRAMLAWISLIVMVVAVPGCTIESERDEDQAAGDQDVPEYQCGDTLEGSIPASAEVRSSLGIDRYDYVLDSVDSAITLDLYDAGGASLGRVIMDYGVEIGAQAVFTTDVRYERDGAVLAAQQTRLQVIGNEAASITRHEVGDDKAVLWATMQRQDERTSTEAFGLQSLALGVPAAAGWSGLTIPMGDEDYRVATLIVDGGSLDEGAVDAILSEAPAVAISDNEAFQRMVAAAEDPAWADRAALSLRRCAASGVDDAERALLFSQALTGQSLGQVTQAQSCADQSNPFAKVIQIESMLGAIGTGATLTGVLIAAGVVSGGWAIGAALVITTVGSYIILNEIEAAVQDQAKKAPGIRDLVNLGSDAGYGGSNDSGSSSRGAGSRGDPHLLTFDGLDYDFQGAGEFVLFEPLGGDGPTVQVRQEPSSGICSDVALNTAVAAEIGGLQVHLATDSSRDLVLDGEPAALPGPTFLLPSGDSIQRDGSTVTLWWASGERLAIGGVGAGRSLDIDASLPASSTGNVRGLLGTYDGDRGNDLTMRDGVVVGEPAQWENVMAFGDSYRIDASESLFSYAAGESTDTFTIAGFPSGPIGLEDLPASVRAEAEQTCLDAGVQGGVSLSNCILDVGCTEDDSFADSHVGVQADRSLAVSKPIDFSGWIEEGEGNWEVAPDGRSVFQSSNGPPAFFLSPEEYLGVEIQGTLRVEGGDDDYIGFVFGYQSPLTSAGDAPDDLVTNLLSWKGQEQGYYGTAYEGFTLSRATGVLDPLDEILWSHPGLPVYTVLGTDYGEDRGWDRDVTYAFRLVYAESVVEIAIDGEQIFRVTSAEAGASFEAGRFGFYNYSQPSVRYADFEVTALP